MASKRTRELEAAIRDFARAEGIEALRATLHRNQAIAAQLDAGTDDDVVRFAMDEFADEDEFRKCAGVKRIEAKYVTEIKADDPDTGGEVAMEVWKDPESGGMFAVDSSFLEQDTDEIPSPFNAGTILVLPDSVKPKRKRKDPLHRRPNQE